MYENDKRVNIGLQNFSGKVEKDHVKGAMNNGEIPVNMRAPERSASVRFYD